MFTQFNAIESFAVPALLALGNGKARSCTADLRRMQTALAVNCLKTAADNGRAASAKDRRVGDTGLEHPRQTREVRMSADNCANFVSSSDTEAINSHPVLPVSDVFQPADLARIIEVWTVLPQAIRQAIVAIIDKLA